MAKLTIHIGTDANFEELRAEPTFTVYLFGLPAYTKFVEMYALLEAHTISAAKQNARMVVVNVEEQKILADQYKVTAIPTYFYSYREHFDEIEVGTVSKRTYIRAVSEYITTTDRLLANSLLMKPHIMECTTEKEYHEIIDAHKVVIVDFHAEWCGPCKI